MSAHTFGVVVDTSASMDRKILGHALGAIASFAVARDVAAVRLVACDVAAFDYGFLPPGTIGDRIELRGRGGTRLQPGIDQGDRMVWTTLVDWTAGAIYRGAVLRFPAHWPYESIVDFLVFDPADGDRGLGLIVDSGYKAGLTLVRLPKESAGAYDGSCICPRWLVGNWSAWVYPETPVEQVFISPRRPVPRLPLRKTRDIDSG